jgi:hypothetical protein
MGDPDILKGGKMEALKSVKIFGATYPVAQHYIPEDLHPK